MPQYKGNLQKMSVKNGSEIEYTLNLGSDNICLNNYIGKEIEIRYTGIINCMVCGKVTKKSFAQGHCYNCFCNSPSASECILHPLKCQAQYGVSRDAEWSESHCLKPHIVYLAASPKLKVGITRKSQIPTRWIDQGATSAIEIAEVPNRHIAGVMEKFLMQYYSDKTNWKAMLLGDNMVLNLNEEKEKAINTLPEELKKYTLHDSETLHLCYPSKGYKSLNTINLDKQQSVKGVLSGIKGQYLIINSESAINIRKHSSYLVELFL